MGHTTSQENAVAAGFAETRSGGRECAYSPERVSENGNRAVSQAWLLFDPETDGARVLELEKKKNAFTRLLSQVVTGSSRCTENCRQFGTEEKCEYETFVTNRFPIG